jgi:4-amino-4-deoxy-L-arabinose transferase-like glycosyltransferase
MERAGATRPQRRAFVAAVMVGALLRIGVLASKWGRDLVPPLNDSLWYSAQSVAIADGRGFADPFYGGPSAEHGPLTPILLAPVSWVDDPVRWQRLVMTVLGIVTVVLVGLLARRLGGWWAGVAGASIAAVYPNLWMNDSLVMSETPAILLVVLVLWLALDLVGVGRSPDDRPERTPTVARAVSMGVAVGLASLARSELLLLAPLLILVVVVQRRHEERPWGRDSLCVLAGTVLVLVPWVVPNLVRFERPVLLTTNDGTTLLGANCDDSWSGPDIGGWSLFCVLDEGSPEGEDPSVRSARQRRLAVDHVLDNAGRAPLVVAARLGRGIDLVGVPNLVAGDVGEERYRWASWTGVVAWWLLLVPAVIGLVRLRPPARWVLLAPVVSVAVTMVVFYGGHRIRAPLEPVVAVSAGLAFGAFVDRRAAGAPS